jgi:hypothetical protein
LKIATKEFHELKVLEIDEVPSEIQFKYLGSIGATHHIKVWNT